MEAKKVIKIVLIVVAAVFLFKGLLLLGGFMLAKEAAESIDTDSGRAAFESEEMHVLNALPKYRDGEKWLHGFRDFTVYGEYHYDGLTKEDFERSGCFKPVDEALITELTEDFIESYEHYVEDSSYSAGMFGDDLTQVYRFKKDIMDTDDWCCIEAASSADYPGFTDEQAKTKDYNIYYYDTQTATIYFMHNDI